MPGNTFGSMFRVTTWGESHGPALGAVVDGCPPGLTLTAEDINQELAWRRARDSRVSTSRREPDQVEVLSGVLEGRTTGTPISLVIYNRDVDSSAYDDLKNVFRPGHADYTYWHKYGIRERRGGGRASGRETVARVAAGAVAKKVLDQHGITVLGYTLALGGVRAQNLDFGEIFKNPLFCPDPEAVPRMIQRLQEIKEAGDSAGGVVEVRAQGCPAGLGEPVFAKGWRGSRGPGSKMSGRPRRTGFCQIGCSPCWSSDGDWRGERCRDRQRLCSSRNARLREQRSLESRRVSFQ